MQADGSIGTPYRSIFIWNSFTGQREVACNPPVPPSEPTQGGKGPVGEMVSLISARKVLIIWGSVWRIK